MKRQLFTFLVMLTLSIAMICTPAVNADKADNLNNNLIEDDQIDNDSSNVSSDYVEDEIFVDATVNVHMLNLRCGAGTDYSIVRVLKKGDQLKVFGQYNRWYIVQDVESGTIGCVSSYYITLKNNESVNNDTNELDETKELLNMINNIRQQNGLSPLLFNEELARVAEHKAIDMVENNYFDHTSPIYGTPFEMMKKYGINFNSAAENISGNQSVKGAVYSWLNSEEHLTNILNSDYTVTGIGIYTSPVYGKIYVQLFSD